MSIRGNNINQSKFDYKSMICKLTILSISKNKFVRINRTLNRDLINFTQNNIQQKYNGINQTKI